MSETYWRLIKNAKSGVKHVTVGTTTTAVLGNNPKRMALVIGADPSSVIHICLGHPDASATDLTLPAGFPPIILSRWLHGELVTREVHAISITNPSAIAVYEVSAPELP